MMMMNKIKTESITRLQYYIFLFHFFKFFFIKTLMFVNLKAKINLKNENIRLSFFPILF